MRPKRKDKHTKRVPQPSGDGQNVENEQNKSAKVQIPSTSSSNIDQNPDDDDHEEIQQSYKREIRSNWDRYKEDKVHHAESGEVDGPQLRGADFAQLLATTGEMPHSRFQFKDEKDWDETPEDAFNAVLSLDCADLAKSLKCIPIPTLLDIPQNKFTNEQLQKFADAAKNHSALYKSHIIRSHLTPIKTYKVPLVNVKQKELTHKITPKVETTQVDEAEDVDNKPFETPTRDEDHFEDELDQLLAMAVPKNFQKPAISLPDIDKLILSPSISSPVMKPDVQTTTSKPETSLEDWLDDFLQE